MEAAPLGVLVDPPAQARPLAQQGLVGDLDDAVADGDQAAGRRGREHVRDLVVPVEVELGERRPAAHGAHRASPSPTRRSMIARTSGLRSLGDAGVGRLGQARHRAVDAPGLAVGSQGQRAVLPLLPELEQRGRQQRQRAGLALHVGDQRVGELGLDAQARPARRAARSPGAAPRAASARPARGSRRAARPVRDRRRTGRSSRRAARRRRPRGRAGSRRAGERVDESGALGVRAAGGEQLLELIDRRAERAPGAACRAPRRAGPRLPNRARAEALPAGARPAAGARAASARCPAGSRRRGPGGGRRAGATTCRCPTGRRCRARPAPDEAGDELGDKPLAAEEESASAGSKLARPLNGQVVRRGRAGGRGREGACLVAHRAAGRSRCRPARPRPRSGRSARRRCAAATAARRRLASSAATASTAAGELAAAREALLRLLRERRGDDGVEGRGQRGAGARWARAAPPRGARTRRRCPSRARNGGAPDQALVEHAAERVDVGAPVDRRSPAICSGAT